MLSSLLPPIPPIIIGALLAIKDSFKYLGMVFYKTHNIAKSAEHMPYAVLDPFMACCHSIGQIAREHHFIDWPHALFWFAERYAILASLYTCQVHGS